MALDGSLGITLTLGSRVAVKYKARKPTEYAGNIQHFEVISAITFK